MKIVKRSLVACVFGCLLGLATSALWNLYENWAALQRVSIPGTMYRVDDHLMHLNCTGSGSPAVVLSTGLGDNFTVWSKVQPELSKVTRVCSYDRAGTGFSEPRSGIQDADSIAKQLHDLLTTAGVNRPFILMGHSISGLYVRSYFEHYRSDLTGIVLLDPTTPHQEDRLPKAESLAEQRRDLVQQRLLMAVGWSRLRGNCGAVSPETQAAERFLKAWDCDPRQMTPVIQEFDGWGPSEREIDRVRSFGAMPLLIISRDPSIEPGSDDLKTMTAAAYAETNRSWDVLQEEAKMLSSDRRRVIAKGSSHYVQDDRAELVIREVGSLLGHIRRHQPLSDVGTTLVE